MEANVVLFRCSSVKKTFGVRVQKMEDGDWYRTWAFPIDNRTAKNEGFDKTPIRGNMFETDDYLGCPYCHSMDFVQCGKCGKVTCYRGEISVVCEWCGARMDDIVTATDKFNLSGGDY